MHYLLAPTLLAALLAGTTLWRDTIAPIPRNFSARPFGGDPQTDLALKVHCVVGALLEYCWVVFKFLVFILMQN